MYLQIEIKMRKVEGIRWNKLERDTTEETKIKQFNPSKNWGS